MKYKWIGPGVLGIGKNAVVVGDILPEKFSDRIDEFLKDKKIKLIPEAKKPVPVVAPPEADKKAEAPKKVAAPKKAAPKAKETNK